MKKIFSILLVLATFSFVSCEDELDLVPYDGLTDEQLFQNASGFETATKGMYSGFRAFGYYGESIGMLGAPDILADNVIMNPQGRTTQQDLFEWRNTPVDESFGLYERGYKIISRANRILDNLDKLSDGAAKDNFEAEAKTIRALCHFDIARTYCKIPTQSADANTSIGIYYSETFKPTELPRRVGTTVEGVYKKIVADLIDAKAKIAIDNGIGRLNKTAVSAILSRVYLHMGEDQKVIDEANVVISDTKVGIASRTDFGKVWLDEYNKNVLFKIRFTDQDDVAIGNTYSQTDAAGEIRSEYVVAYEFFQLFKADDIRTSTTIQTSVFDENMYNHVKKYLGRAAGTKNTVDAKYIRYEEVILNKAEALANQDKDSDAILELNKIRDQRYTSYSGGESGTALKDAIQLERRLELAFESDRFFTLKRLGKSINRSATNGEFADGKGTPANKTLLQANDFRFQLPIPQGAFDSNPNLTQDDQNPGY
jgi:hypothetical protein